jgi:hypothetical protein
MNYEKFMARDENYGPIKLFLIMLKEWEISSVKIEEILYSKDFIEKIRSIIRIACLADEMYRENSKSVITESRFIGLDKETIKELIEKNTLDNILKAEQFMKELGNL